ncbi:MAG: CRISPR system precrRNA processing endoribonuclease RAMP protein Cas6 [Deltaproteobacteria bacterium]|nr:CRISPR system precrRNA processing endoribonuclease RAMP protein Cas6 [Deltaproteobacteria bacterium]
MTTYLPPVLPLTVTLRTAEPQRLPPFLGSALHGALGGALYRTVCAFPKRERCPGCPLYARCAYAALFETPAGVERRSTPQGERERCPTPLEGGSAAPAAANDALHAAGIRDQAPRPLVLASEPGWTRTSGNPFRLAADCDVPFRLTLIGRAIDDLPVVIVALQAMARRGLGIPEERERDGERHRAAMQLVGVTTDSAHVVYDAESERFNPPPTAPAPDSGGAGEATIEFVTPLRLKHQGRLAGTVTPPLFFDTLAQRANALAVLFGDNAAAVDRAAAVAAAHDVAVVATRLRRVHVTRYSARQRQRMQWPGLMGTLHWRGGALRELWPLLHFGERVQVGKGTALGFGRYMLRGAA